MKRVARDGIFAFVIAGIMGAYTYVLGFNNGAKEATTTTETEAPADGSEEEELSSDTQ